MLTAFLYQQRQPAARYGREDRASDRNPRISTVSVGTVLKFRYCRFDTVRIPEGATKDANGYRG